MFKHIGCLCDNFKSGVDCVLLTDDEKRKDRWNGYIRTMLYFKKNHRFEKFYVGETINIVTFSNDDKIIHVIIQGVEVIEDSIFYDDVVFEYIQTYMITDQNGDVWFFPYKTKDKEKIQRAVNYRLTKHYDVEELLHKYYNKYEYTYSQCIKDFTETRDTVFFDEVDVDCINKCKKTCRNVFILNKVF